MQQIVLQEYVDTVITCGKRVAALDAQASAVWPVIEAMLILRVRVY